MLAKVNVFSPSRRYPVFHWLCCRRAPQGSRPMIRFLPIIDRSCPEIAICKTGLVGAANLAAGYFIAGTSGGLCCEIVRVGVNDNGTAYDFRYCKTVCEEHHKCMPFIAEKRRHITGVGRMQTVFRIVVLACSCERVCTIAGTSRAFVNMKCEDIRRTILTMIGESVYIRFYQNARFCLKK